MKIPPEAKRVFKGVIFDVYQWQQEMFDGSFETFERLKRPNTVEVIPIMDGKIVLSEQEQPTLGKFHSVLGGRQEEGEEPLACAKRELLEESGLASDDWELIRTYAPDRKMEWTIYVYVARNCKKVAEQQLDCGEKISLLHVDFEKFLEILFSETFWGASLAFDVFKLKERGQLDSLKKQFFG